MNSNINTIDRCFRDAQTLLGAADDGVGQLSKTYNIFTALQPIITNYKADGRLAILALAIWRTRGENIKITTKSAGKEVSYTMAGKREPTKSKQVKTSSRTYFFDIETTNTKDKKQYLKITESRKDKDKFLRNSIYVFPEDAKEFFSVVSEMVKSLGKK